MIERAEALKLLNGENGLENLKKMVNDEPKPAQGRDVNNHIHTQYSFSPYSPTAAAWFAYQAGLCTCGLMDHDSISGAEEFLNATKVVGLGATIGIECRVSMKKTPFGDRKTNNPDQAGVSYMTLHGVPHQMVGEVDKFFAPYRAHRNERNRKMIAAVNELMGGWGMTIDFDKDVLPLSNYAKGGSVTERHISSALAYKMIEVTGGGQKLVDFIKNELKLNLSAKIEGFLLDESNPHAMYDLLGWIKSTLISKFYIDATDECPDIFDVLALANRIGAIPAYAYLGDVGDSVTGDKKAQKFEDDFIDELVPYVKSIGFKAITYMPSRNTKAQLDHIRGLCEQYDLFQISGEDINQPRQSFVCEAQRRPEFNNLYEATWALIAHEWRSSEDLSKGLFSEETIAKYPKLSDRVAAFAAFGKEYV